MPEKLKQFLASLNMDDADEIDAWLDGEPDAVEEMREVTYPLTLEGSREAKKKGKKK